MTPPQQTTSSSTTDPMRMKMELKRAKQEEKMKKKQQKREKKMLKAEKKRQKKEEKLRAKLAARGIKLPPKAEKKVDSAAPSTSISTSKSAISEGEQIAEAEIIRPADVWEPKSAKKIDDIQKHIDRMDQKSVKSLKERYKDRYGEDLDVPDIYNINKTIAVESAEETGELEKLTGETTTTPSSGVGSGADAKEKSRFGFGGKAKKTEKKEKVKIDRPLRFLDYRTPLYLRDKYGTDAGGGKRAGLTLVDIIHNIIFTIIIVKIITTIVYVVKDNRERKFIESMQEQSAQPQTTT